MYHHRLELPGLDLHRNNKMYRMENSGVGHHPEVLDVTVKLVIPFLDQNNRG